MNWYHFLSKDTTNLRKKSARLSPDTVMPTIIYTKCLMKNLRHLIECTFREKWYSHYIKSWSNDVSKFCKLDTYRNIKSDYRKEPYILYVHIKRHQQTLTTQIAKFMASTWVPPGSCRPMNLSIREGYELVLIISTLSAGGRHCRTITPRNERLCNFCSLDQVDDEKHFLMACNFHSTERQSLLEVIIPILKLDRESDTTELFY